MKYSFGILGLVLLIAVISVAGTPTKIVAQDCGGSMVATCSGSLSASCAGSVQSRRLFLPGRLVKASRNLRTRMLNNRLNRVASRVSVRSCGN